MLEREMELHLHLFDGCSATRFLEGGYGLAGDLTRLQEAVDEGDCGIEAPLLGNLLLRLALFRKGGRGQDNPEVRGTMWAAYNAVTEWVDYERGRDGTRLEAAWYGEGRRIKQRGLEVATELAKAE